MSIVDIVESPRARLGVVVGLALIFLASAGVEITRFLGGSILGWQDSLGDFQDYRIVASMIDHGLVDKSYHLRDLVAHQLSYFPDYYPMPWTYPPQFDLVVWLLARLPLAAAYVLFMAATFALYAHMMRRLAPGGFVAICLLLAPSLAMLLRSGQNGFLSGALIGWTAIGLVEGRAWAGGPLGLMAIKPHLALTMGFHIIFARRWKLVGLAVVVVAATSLAATVAFGASIWLAFLGGVKEAGIFLAASPYYPFYRMVSLYALLRSLGVGPGLASALQAGLGVGVIVLTDVALRRFSLRQAVGVAAIASVMVSPYAYEYDLPALGVGLALLFDDIVAHASRLERAGFYAALLALQTAGYVAALFADFGGHGVKPFAFPALVPLLTLAFGWRVLERARKPVSVAAPLETCPA